MTTLEAAEARVAPTVGRYRWLIVVLLFRPSGLLGEKIAEKV